MSDRLALANAIEDAGIERSKAERVASVIFDAIHDNVANKADVEASAAALRGEIAAVGADVRASEAAIRGELKTEIAPVRSTIASEVARLDTQNRTAGRQGRTDRAPAADPPGRAHRGGRRGAVRRPALLAAALSHSENA